MVNSPGDIFPLYDRIKLDIYFDFKLLKEYSAKIRTTRNIADRNLQIRNFREAFDNFYQDVNDEQKIIKLDKHKQVKLKKYYDKLQRINETNVHVITSLCRELINLMGITKIEYKNKDPGSAMSTGNK